MKTIENIIDRTKLPHWLILLVLVLFLLRVPSFFEPYSYGDEMIYLTLGQGIRQGVELYSGVHDNKPPLLYIIAAISGNLFFFKFILAFWALATVILFWKLLSILFPSNEKLVKIASIIFGLLTTLPLLEGNIVNSELFMIGLTILAFIILFTKNLSNKILFISGILFGMGSLFKIPAIFDFPVIILFWFIYAGLNRQDLTKLFQKSVILLIGLLTPIFLSFVWYAAVGAFNEYLVAGFLQNFGYLSSFRPGDVQKSFLEKNMPLLVRGLIVLLGIVILYIKRTKLSKEFVFTTIWLLCTLFAITLSERPYPHYLIQAVAPISILFGMLFTLKNKEQTLVIIPLTLALIIPVYFKFWYYPTFSYYTRFLSFITQQSSKDLYYAGFDSNVSRNYKIADFLVNSTRQTDKVFVWGDSSPIYALSRRLPPIKYVADYHISDFSSNNEVANKLAESKPKFIVILPRSKAFPEIKKLLQSKYLLVNTIDGAQIWDYLEIKK